MVFRCSAGCCVLCLHFCFFLFILTLFLCGFLFFHLLCGLNAVDERDGLVGREGDGARVYRGCLSLELLGFL